MTEAQTILKLIEAVDPSDTAKMDEMWKPVVGYEGLYEVSNKGTIRTSGTKRVKKVSKWGNGYLRVTLNSEGRGYNTTVASIVCTAFHGPRPKDYTIDHIDGNKQNNNADNLEWVTQRENVARLHRRKKGDSLGIFYDTKTNRHSAQISVGRRKVTLGWYKTEQEAIAAYQAAYRMTEVFDVRA